MTEKMKLVKWTNHDLAILKALYPTGGIEAVYEALDGRHTRGSIKTTAYNWNIRCEVPAWKLREMNGKRREAARRYVA
jgi:hypothetical protein